MMNDRKNSKGVTVAQLIEKLKAMPQDAIVVRKTDDDYDLKYVRVSTVGKPAERKHYDGRLAQGRSGTYPHTIGQTVVIR